MIQLHPVPRPAELTEELVQRLTQDFKADKKQRVWDRPFIKTALLTMSSGKCCYCECNVTEESKYMEVEHFKCKDRYEDDVLVWSNLLPSCKRCNGNKLDHDTENEPIIHPVYHDPREHLTFRDYRFYPKTAIGQASIKIVNLNERERLQLKRFKIGAKLKEELDELEEHVQDFLETTGTPRKQRRIISKLRGIMEQGQPTEEYAATVATEILREPSYHFAKTELTKLGLWDEEFQRLEVALMRIAF